MRAYEHIVAQNKNKTDIKHLHVVFKSIIDSKRINLQFCLVDYVPAHTYIINNRSSHLQNLMQKIL